MKLQDGTPIGIALALVLACAAPTWVSVPLMVKSSRWVGRRWWLRVLAATYVVAAQILGWWGFGRVYHLIGPSRPMDQGIVEGAWFANLGLFLFSIAWINKRQGRLR